MRSSCNPSPLRARLQKDSLLGFSWPAASGGGGRSVLFEGAAEGGCRPRRVVVNVGSDPVPPQRGQPQSVIVLQFNRGYNQKTCQMRLSSESDISMRTNKNDFRRF
jgi:hypothetical protein